MALSFDGLAHLTAYLDKEALHRLPPRGRGRDEARLAAAFARTLSPYFARRLMRRCSLRKILAALTSRSPRAEEKLRLLARERDLGRLSAKTAAALLPRAADARGALDVVARMAEQARRVPPGAVLEEERAYAFASGNWSLFRALHAGFAAEIRARRGWLRRKVAKLRLELWLRWH